MTSPVQNPGCPLTNGKGCAILYLYFDIQKGTDGK